MILGVLLATLSLLTGDPEIPDPIDFQLPASNPGRTSINDLWCSDGMPAIPALTCGVGVVTGTDAWECYDRAGNNVPVTQGTNTTYVSSPYGRAAQIDSDAAAPSISSATLTALGIRDLVTRNHTLIAVATATTVSNGVAGVPLGDGWDNGSGFYFRASSGDFKAVYSGGNAIVQAVVVNGAAINGFRVYTGRRVGNSITARLNGAASSATLTIAPAASTNPLYFGRWSNTGQYLGGKLAVSHIFPCGLTDASLAAYEAGIFGDRASDGRAVTTTRAGPAWVRDSEGKQHMLGDNAPAVEAVTPGPLAATNYALNSTRPDLWNHDPGIVFDCSGGDGCLATNTGGGGWIVAGGGFNASYTGPGTLTCEMRSGNTSTIYYGIDDATGGTYQIQLTSDWKRHPYTRTVTPAAYGAVPYLYLANGKSFWVRQCQFETKAYATERLDCGATVCTRGTPGQGDRQAVNYWTWSGNICKASNYDNSTGSCAWVSDTSWGGSGYGLVSDTHATLVSGRVGQINDNMAGRKVTLTCEMASGSLTTARFYAWGATGGWTPAVVNTLTATPTKFSKTYTITADASPPYYFYVNPGSATPDVGTIKVGRCQLEPGDVFSGTWINTYANPAERRSGGGLQSYGSALTYTLNSSRPDLWTAAAGTPTVTSVGDGWYQFVDDDAVAGEALSIGSIVVGIGDPVSVKCRVRPGAVGTYKNLVRILGPNSQYCTSNGNGYFTVDYEQDIACTLTATGAQTAGIQLRQGSGNTDTGSVQVMYCQAEKSAYPGRRCDAGASPTTCPGDVHTVSTAGWPVSNGAIEVLYTPAYASYSADRYAFDSRNGSNGIGQSLRITATGYLVAFTYGGASVSTAAPLTWDAGRTYRLGLRWDGATVTLTRDGAIVATGSNVVITAHAAACKLGVNHIDAGHGYGTISNLEVRPW